MKSLLIVQPIYTSYRDPVFKALSLYSSRCKVVCQRSDSNFGFRQDNCSDFYFFIKWKGGRLKFFNLRALISLSDSDVVLHFADFKYVTLWLLMFMSVGSHKEFYLHGQGGYKSKGFIHKFVYNFALAMSDGYVCYSDFSAAALRNITFKFLHKKISVVSNSLYMLSREVNFSSIENSIFYIGRLRAGCGVEMLLEAAALVSVQVLVVGGGAELYISELKAKYPGNVFYGDVFDEDLQFNVAQKCIAGAYGGDAGLSVVHYMAFGLPVIVHSDLKKHMGPEPSYIVDGINGLLFERGNVQSLAEKIKLLKDDRNLRDKLAKGASETFEKLQTPPMHEKFAKILGLI